MKVLVTGAGGMLGRDVVAACERRGDDVVPVAHAELDITDGPASTSPWASTGPTRSSTARRGPTSTGLRSTKRRRRSSTARPPASPPPRPPRLARASCISRATTSSTGGSAPLMSSPIRRAAVRVRALEARRGDIGRRREPEPLHRPVLVAVRRRGTKLRRDDAAPGRAAARGPRRERPGRLPHLLRVISRARSLNSPGPGRTDSTTSRRAARARGSSSRRRSSTRPTSSAA